MPKEAEKVEAAVAEETVAKSEYDRVVGEYSKLAAAFNKLLREYNDMHIKSLFAEDQQQ